jgi:hypothetical protein
LHFEKVRREDLQPVVDKMLKRVAGWRGELLAYSSRLTLIRACLASIPFTYCPLSNFLSGQSSYLSHKCHTACGIIVKMHTNTI